MTVVVKPDQVLGINSSYISYRKKAEGKVLYDAIKNNLRKEGAQVLRARFFGGSPKGSDLENILFYNIGSGCFSGLIQNGVIFEEMSQEDYNNYGVAPNCTYEYSIIEKSFNPFAGKKQIAICSSSDPGDILNMSVIECWKSIKGAGWAPKAVNPQAKEIYLDITINPEGGRITVDKIKHMLDGIVSSLHKYSGSNDKAIASQLGANYSLLADTSILEDRIFVSIKSDGGLKWNPADDREHLKGCRILKGNRNEIKVLSN